jgi:hypothetical protein
VTTPSEINLNVQVIMNPKYSIPITNFTIQVSLTTLVLVVNDETEFKPNICYINSALENGRGGIYNSTNNILTFNCGVVNSSVGDNNPNKISLGAVITIDNKNNNFKLKNNTVPFVITGIFYILFLTYYEN